MSVIERNEFGAVAVNRGVIEKMIVEDLLGMSDVLLLCNRKGRPIKEKPTPFIDPDYYDAVDYSEKRDEIKIRIYIIMRSGCNVSKAAEKIFDSIEKDFDILRLKKPDLISVKVKGVMSDELIKRNIEIVRNNG